MSYFESLTRPDPDEILAVVGPSGTGKTQLAIALAERFDGEVIIADSVQMYRYFDIGSGKPTQEERARVPHHLLDTADAHEPLDAGRFATMTDAAIAEVRSRGRVPILCGGTFFWVRAVLFGLAPAAGASETIRTRHRDYVEREGRAALHGRLTEVDPLVAARLAPNDFVRVSRALEVFELTGERLSDIHKSHGFASVRYRFRLIGNHLEREELSKRIATRTRAWLAAGWVDEVQRLVHEGYTTTRPMQSVGYRQVFEHVQGTLSYDALAEAIDRATRTFTRRQRTWLREASVEWIQR